MGPYESDEGGWDRYDQAPPFEHDCYGRSHEARMGKLHEVPQENLQATQTDWLLWETQVTNPDKYLDMMLGQTGQVGQVWKK